MLRWILRLAIEKGARGGKSRVVTAYCGSPNALAQNVIKMGRTAVELSVVPQVE